MKITQTIQILMKIAKEMYHGLKENLNQIKIMPKNQLM